MPYANIYWVKLKLELLNDKRFIFDLDDSQKWLFIGLLLLAADTNNKVPNDESFIKSRLNLQNSPEIIRKNLQFILSKFPKLVNKDKCLKFKNFKKMHNPLKDAQRKSKGIPMERIEVEQILEVYIEQKGWISHKENKEMLSDIYKRNCRPIKELFLATGKDVEKAKLAIRKASQVFGGKNLSWTLETVLKHLPDLLLEKKQPRYNYNV